ncbi:MAG: acyl-CoA thioesterase [Desulfobacterales bacterium]|nr:acyl-CoA thioesterase [Desulfobacterales bacterium]MBF0396841.1 acyl-CoA thioesterase [Desulfobacterales bacterium]
MDAFQHVNNIVYFRYFESARIVYFEKIDVLEQMANTGIGPILASTQCKFKIPLTYPDTISIGAKVSKIEEYSFIMEYAVISHKHNKIAAEGEAVIVAYDYKEKKKTTVPNVLKEKILSLEKSHL